MFLLVFSVSISSAQDHKLVITEPPSIAGIYDMLIAGFGPSFCEVDTIQGTMSLAIDGSGISESCDTVTNDMTDLIAVVDRGNCNFTQKVLNAQNKGAIAVIICNNQATDIFNPGGTSDYAALYFPWIDVGEQNQDGNIVYVPPSGHLAGIYARVDGERGVHKAPANEVIRGALGVEKRLSKADQDGLNPDGINVIRQFNGNVTVWGARTLGGDDNGEWKYVNVRRLFLFLRESIDKGTQWVVFEPNTPALWAKITRNVTAFLTNVWAAGALFGDTPEQAFYVKCDEETNPPEVRDLGQVVTEVGLAVVKPAEFVIFRISQWAGPEE